MPFETLDLLNSNSLRNYPIKEGLIKVSTDLLFTIPDNFIVEFQLAATSDVAKKFYISKIVNLPDVITVQISDHDGVIAGTFEITVSTHTLYKDYFFTPSVDYPGANGKLTIGYLTTILGLPTGTFSFTIDNTEFETKCIIPCLNTVNSFVFKDSSGNTVSLTGVVNILGRSNIRFTGSDTDSDLVTDTITMDVGDGLGLNKKCEATPAPILTINNISPDGNGNFTINVANCASLTTLSTTQGLLLNDTCCKPCMGCDEISRLTERVMQIETDLMKLRDHYINLQNVVTEFSNLMNYSCDC